MRGKSSGVATGSFECHGFSPIVARIRQDCSRGQVRSLSWQTPPCRFASRLTRGRCETFDIASTFSRSRARSFFSRNRESNISRQHSRILIDILSWNCCGDRDNCIPLRFQHAYRISLNVSSVIGRLFKNKRSWFMTYFPRRFVPHSHKQNKKERKSQETLLQHRWIFKVRKPTTFREYQSILYRVLYSRRGKRNPNYRQLHTFGLTFWQMIFAQRHCAEYNLFYLLIAHIILIL